MGLESGTWVEDLVVTNPPSTDDKRQGDDHLRLIKTVLKNTFKRTSGRPVFFPTSIVITNNYTILDVDENTIFRCNTSGGPFTLTLPNTLTTANAGWKVIIVKTNTDAIPVFIVPPSGTLDGFTKVRRTTENKRTEVMWTGVGWMITRPDSAPIGTTHEYYGSVLPNGYLWPDGTTFNATDFTELNAVLGTNTKPDLRGRGSFGRDDMGGSAANRVTAAGSGITGTTLKAAGGDQTLAQHIHTFTTDIENGGEGHSHGININTGNESATHTHAFSAVLGPVFTGQPGGSNVAAPLPAGSNTGTESASHHHNVSGDTDIDSHQHTGTTDNNAGIDAIHQNMPPAIVCNKIIVAE